MARVARHYYLDDRSKSEIADDLGISRFRVARLLDAARRERHGHDRRSSSPAGVDTELSVELQSAFGLAHAIVVDVPRTTTPRACARGWAGGRRAAAGHRHPRRRARAGLGPLAARHRRRRSRTLAPCPVVQLTGALSGPDGSDVLELVRRVAQASGGTPHVFYAPLVAPDAASARALRRQPDVAAGDGPGRRVTVAFVGIGAWEAGLVHDLRRGRRRGTLAGPRAGRGRRDLRRADRRDGPAVGHAARAGASSASPGSNWTASRRWCRWPTARRRRPAVARGAARRPRQRPDHPRGLARALLAEQRGASAPERGAGPCTGRLTRRPPARCPAARPTAAGCCGWPTPCTGRPGLHARRARAAAAPGRARFRRQPAGARAHRRAPRCSATSRARRRPSRWPTGPAPTTALARSGRLLRDYHDHAADVRRRRPRDLAAAACPARWRGPVGHPQRRPPGERRCSATAHAVALIDFDLAAPGHGGVGPRGHRVLLGAAARCGRHRRRPARAAGCAATGCCWTPTAPTRRCAARSPTRRGDANGGSPQVIEDARGRGIRRSERLWQREHGVHGAPPMAGRAGRRAATAGWEDAP